MPVKLRVDREADALYLRLDDSVIVESRKSRRVSCSDYNEANEVVGVEMLRLSERSSGVNLSACNSRLPSGLLGYAAVEEGTKGGMSIVVMHKYDLTGRHTLTESVRWTGAPEGRPHRGDQERDLSARA